MSESFKLGDDVGVWCPAARLGDHGSTPVSDEPGNNQDSGHRNNQKKNHSNLMTHRFFHVWESKTV